MKDNKKYRYQLSIDTDSVMISQSPDKAQSRVILANLEEEQLYQIAKSIRDADLEDEFIEKLNSLRMQSPNFILDNNRDSNLANKDHSEKTEPSWKSESSNPRMITPEEYKRISGEKSTNRMTIFGVPNIPDISEEE